MKDFLRQPYPFRHDLGYVLRIALGIGGAVVIFLLVFQPFSLMDFNHPSKPWIIGGYGLLTFLTILINNYLLPIVFTKVFDEDRWKVWKQILWLMWMFFCVGTLNLLYSHRLGFVPLSIGGFIRFQFITLAIGIIPVSLLTLILQIRYLRANLQSAQSLNENLEGQPIPPHIQPTDSPITLTADNEKDHLSLFPDEILFIAAAENYVEVYSRQSHQLKKVLLRSSLKRVEEALKGYPRFYRCHRSYLVNLHNISGITGNSQGYRLKFEGTEQTVPVARNQRAELEGRLNAR